MLSVPSALEGLHFEQSKHLATCWKITRRDGVVLRFTSHAEPLTFGGEVYTPSGAPAASARRREAALKEHDLEFKGAIVSDQITSEDLRSGRYRDAQVDEYSVDYRFAFAGAFYSLRYWIGSIEYDGVEFAASMAGPERWLKKTFGQTHGRVCHFRLGDTDCGVNLASFTISGVVEGCLDGEAKRVIKASTLGSFSDNYFAQGEIVFTSGPNDGLRGDVKSSVGATLEIELQLPMPFRIEPGDTFDIIAGCNGLKRTCKDKFSNLPQFGGDPYIPGADRVLRTHP